MTPGLVDDDDGEPGVVDTDESREQVYLSYDGLAVPVPTPLPLPSGLRSPPIPPPPAPPPPTSPPRHEGDMGCLPGSVPGSGSLVKLRNTRFIDDTCVMKTMVINL